MEIRPAIRKTDSKSDPHRTLLTLEFKVLAQVQNLDLSF